MYNFNILIGILVEPSSRRIVFDGSVAEFVDGTYCFVNERLSEFGCAHIPPWFFDCYGGSQLTEQGAEELGWFANTLALALADYPERWDVLDLGGQFAPVDREALRQQLVLLGEIVQRAKVDSRTIASFGD